MSQIVAHRRQFVLGPQPYDRVGWRYRDVDSRLVLSYSPSLVVGSEVDQDGCEWILLGSAAQSEPVEPDPIASLSSHSGDIEGLIRTWAGRWVLIGDGTLRMDASGLLGCFLRIVEEGTNTGGWISSSPQLLRELKGSPEVGPRVGHLSYFIGMDWYPPPISAFPGISRLSTSQLLDLSNGATAVRYRAVPSPLSPAPSEETLLKAIQDRLVAIVQNLSRVSDGMPWLALTAGTDSRLTLAAAMAAGIGIRTYTQDLPFHLIDSADRVLPPLLSQEAGFAHHLIRPLKRSLDDLEAWDEHTARYAVGADRLFVAKGQWQQIPAGRTVIRSGLYETAQRPHHDYPAGPVDIDIQLNAISDDHGRSRPVEPWQLDGLRKWLEWVGEDTLSTMDWRDRFHLEQAIGGRRSSTEQGLDATLQTSFQVANCSALFSELLTLDPNLRLGAGHHLELINRMAPTLLKYPINPRDPWPRRAAGKAIREAIRLRASKGAGWYAKSLRRRFSPW